MLNFLKRWRIFFILLLVELILFITNYRPGTFLMGWDNIYPELNFKANLERNIFSVWQEYRGLGVLDGMAHAALLPHTLVIFLLSFVLPLSLLRYFSIFFLHFLGGVGMYLLLKKLTTHNLPPTTYHPQLLSLFGALFYQLNLVTVQIFFTPLEVFSYHFAFMPILLYSLLEFVDKGKRKYLLLFSLFSFLSLPQAHVPSVFLVYLFLVIVVLFFKIFQTPLEGNRIKRSITALFIVFMINGYWGLPYVYTALNASRTIINSKINQMSTDNVVLRNKAFGNFTSVALLRGFTLDYVDFQPTNENDYMMGQWRNHTRLFPVFLISVVFFLIVLSGLVKAIVNKQKTFYPFITLFVFTFFMLGNDIPLISLFSQLVQTVTPLFYNVFRFTFTKFSLLYAFCYAIFLTYGLEGATNVRFKKKIYTILFWSGIFIFLSVYTWPSLRGNFMYRNLRVNIPKSYFDLISYLKSQNKNARIATLPQPSFWGWVYYQWGVRGSGFIWYGLPQPSMDGAFYPWSRENENYYWEITQAIYSENQQMFEKVLEKYQINWLIIDHNLISPFSPKALFADKLEEMISRSDKIAVATTFGKIVVYRVNLETKPKDFVFLASNLPVVEPKYQWNNYDLPYLENGNYVSAPNSDSSTVRGVHSATSEVSLGDQIYYPFRSLFTGRKQEELEFTVEDQNDYFSFKAKIPKELAGAKLVIPELNSEEISEIDENDLSKMQEKYPQIFLDGETIPLSLQVSSPSGEPALDAVTPEVFIALPYIREGNLEVRVPKIKGYYSYNLEPFDFAQGKPKSCDQFNKGIYKHERVKRVRPSSSLRSDPDLDLLRLISIDSSNCLDFDLPRLAQRLSYLVTVESRNIEGKSLLFSVINKNSQRTDIETYLQKHSPGRSRFATPSRWPNGLLEGEIDTTYFIQPPMEQYGLGYTLHFDNVSIGRVQTVNDLGRITVNPIPYRFLTSLKIIKPLRTQGVPLQSSLQSPLQNLTYRVDHPNPSFYQITIRLSDLSTPGESSSATPGVSLGRTDNLYLILSQSFDKGWRAYEITNNWLVDSWYMKLLIPLFGKEIKNHVLVNNWENGWLIQPTTHNLQPTTIIIVYLPQYLEYFGFLLLGGCLVVFMIKPNFFPPKQQFKA